MSKLPFLRYCVYKVFTMWSLLTPNDHWPPPKTIGFCTQCGTPTSQIWDLSKLPFRYRVYKVFTIWSLLTPNDLWPPPKTIGFLYSMWYTYIPNMRSVQASLFQISCLQAGVRTSPLLTPNDLWPPPKTIGFLYSMWYTYIPNMRSVQASLFQISCLQAGVRTSPLLTPNDLLTSTKNNRVLVLNVVHLHIKYEICPSFPSWDIVFTRFSQFHPCWPQMTFDLHLNKDGSCTLCGTPTYQTWDTSKLPLLRYRVYKVFTMWSLLTPNEHWPPPKTIGFCTQCGTPTYQIWDMSKLPFLRYCVYKVFTMWSLLTPNDHWPPPKTIGFCTQCGTPTSQIWDLSKLPFRYRVYKVFTIWSLLTPNDLWPPPKTIGFLYSMWYTYIPNMRSVQASLFQISCLQAGVRTSPLLTPNDLWPPPKTIGFLYSMWYTYIPNMRSVQASLFQISCLQAGVRTSPLLTPNDLWPPPKTIGFLYSMWYTYIPNTRSVQVSLLEILYLQGFHNLTPVDPKWPLTSTKNNRVLVFNVVHLNTKYEICRSFPSWDMVFTIWCLRGATHTHIHTHIRQHDYDFIKTKKESSLERLIGCNLESEPIMVALPEPWPVADSAVVGGVPVWSIAGLVEVLLLVLVLSSAVCLKNECWRALYGLMRLEAS